MDAHWHHYLIRPARIEDLDGVLRLSAAGGHTLTTLPENREFLEKRLKRSIHAFYPEVGEPGAESYTFLLQDLLDGELHGISGLQAKTGGFEPFYTYERVSAENRYDPLGIRQRIERLECRTWHSGPSELGSLYLLPEGRGRGVGKLLSLSRLLFAAAFPERFEASVIAEIRGWQDADGESPFWRQVIEPFFGTGFAKIDAVSGTGSKDFIRALLPEFPIYCDLLPAEVRAVIGKAHNEAEPARQLLLRLGFQMTPFVDVFDAGPTVQASLRELPTARACRSIERMRAEKALPAAPSGICFVPELDFRSVLVAEDRQVPGTILLSEAQADVLAPLDPRRFRYYPLTHS